MNNRRRGLVHPAPWNQKELHLGPADDCHTCSPVTSAWRQAARDEAARVEAEVQAHLDAGTPISSLRIESSPGHPARVVVEEDASDAAFGVSVGLVVSLLIWAAIAWAVAWWWWS